MKLSVICLLYLLSERLELVLDAVRGECRLNKDTHDFKDGPANLEVVLDDGNEAKGGDGDVNLYSHSIFGLSPEPLDLKMLLDPFEEQLHLLPVFIKKSDVLGYKIDLKDAMISEIIGLRQQLSVDWLVTKSEVFRLLGMGGITGLKHCA